MSRTVISNIERGLAGPISAETLAKIGAALDARLDIGLRWHGEGLDRLLDSAHARLVEQVAELLTSNRWDVAVEASFAISGERGSIDVFARHSATGSLLVVEVKSVVPDNQAMLHGLDRKVRLAPRIALERGWEPIGPTSRLLVIGDGSTARRQIAALAITYATTLPDRGAAVRAWLRRPEGRIAGLVFLPYVRPTGASHRTTGVSRVRGPRRSLVEPISHHLSARMAYGG